MALKRKISYYLLITNFLWTKRDCGAGASQYKQLFNNYSYEKVLSKELCFYYLSYRSRNLSYFKKTKTIHTRSHLKCIRLVSVRSSLPFIHIGVRIKLTFCHTPLSLQTTTWRNVNHKSYEKLRIESGYTEKNGFVAATELGFTNIFFCCNQKFCCSNQKFCW